MPRKPLTAKQTIAAARGIACKYLPFLSTALYALIPQETKTEKTLAVTDKGVLFYNGEFVTKHGPKLIAAVLVHEVNHLLRDHHARFKRLVKTPTKQLAELWNIAGDLAINGVQPDTLPLPPGCVYPKDFGLPSGKTMEWYFAQLRKQQPKGAAGPGGAGGGSGQQGPGCGSCGSCAGARKSSEPADGTLDGVGRSDIELERIRDTVAEAALQHEKTHGEGSSGLLWWAKERLKPPTIRWEQLLASMTRRAVAFQEGFLDYRDDVPDPQQGVLGWGPNVPLLPTLIAPVPQVAFFVDRSGSMGTSRGAELEQVAREVPGVLSAISAPITFGAFDGDVTALQQVSSVEAALKLFIGGGGTDFCPIFKVLREHRGPKPSVLIIGTDGCGPAPDLPPKGMTVIWLLVGSRARKPFNSTGADISWGNFIFTDPALRGKAIAA